MRRHLGNSTLEADSHRPGRLGDRRRMAIRMGTAGRRRLDRDDSARGRARLNWIDTAADLRARPFRGSRRPGAARYPARRAAVRVHEVQPGVGRRREHVAQPRSAIDSQGSRTEPAPPADGAHRSVSDSLAGLAGEPARTRSRLDRRGVDDADKLRDEGKVAFIGVSNFDVAQLTAHFAHRNADQPAAAVLDAAPGDRAGDSAVLPGAQHRRDSVLADAVGPAHRQDDARAHRVAARRGLAPQQPLLSGADAEQGVLARGAPARDRRRSTAARPAKWRLPGRCGIRRSPRRSSARGTRSRSTS